MNRRPHTQLALMLALTAALFFPAAAFAQRAPSDAIAGVPLSSGAVSASIAPDIDARAGILLTSDGRVLWSRQQDAKRAMASTTKMMTALVALKRVSLDETVTISKAATQVEYPSGLKAGEKLSVRKILELMLVASSNDAAWALGEHVGGSMPAFVKMMNEEAASLGLTKTHYANPHGLDARGHFTSATDLAKLARTIMEYPEVRRIVSMKRVSIGARRSRRTFLTTDEMLGRYRGIVGVKTGFTDDAGFCFVSQAERDGVTLVAVILGTGGNTARFAQTARLLDWGFKHQVRRPLSTGTETVGAVPVSGDPTLTVAARVAEATSAVLFDLDGAVTSRTLLETSVVAPVFAGQPLGVVVYSQGDRTLARMPVVAAAPVASLGRRVGGVPVTDYVDRTVDAHVGAVTSTPVFDPDTVVSRRVVLDSQVAAPVAEGQPLGRIVYEQAGRVVVSVPIVAATTVEAPGALEKLGIWFVRGWREVFGGPKVATLSVE